MPTAIHPIRVNHMNVVVEDFAASLSHLRRLYDAEFLLDLPQAEWHAYLVEIGGVIFEPFVPPAPLLNARYGPHYLGIEYQADMTEAREAVATHGIRIVRDIGVALHTHPADCFGVSFEFYDGSFHGNDWPLLGGPMKSPDYWRGSHPLELAGLKGYTLAVADLHAAAAFLQGFLGAAPLQDLECPAIAARGLSLRVADATIYLLTPTGDGILAEHHRRFGDGIRSTIFATADTEGARRHLASRGATFAAGTLPDSFAVAAEANLGLIFEFAACGQGQPAAACP